MRLNHLCVLLIVAFSFQLVAQWGGQALKEGDIINDSKTGKQGDYNVEYWKNGGSGTMTLGPGCDYSCEWGSVNNILFRKGLRPGSREVNISYSADYKPQGNSYLSVYGWFQNPLVEYYIIESWGTWRPPGGAKKSTVTSDSGTYEIYSNSRTGESIEGNKTFTQYWSVRTVKRTSGVITCKNHFDAWEKQGMTIGKFYEVSFNVEAYQSPGGSANVKIKMYTGPTAVAPNSTELVPRVLALSSSDNPNVLYNIIGQKMDGYLKIIGTKQHSVILNTSGKASGVLYSVPEKK